MASGCGNSLSAHSAETRHKITRTIFDLHLLLHVLPHGGLQVAVVGRQVDGEVAVHVDYGRRGGWCVL